MYNLPPLACDGGMVLNVAMADEGRNVCDGSQIKLSNDVALRRPESTQARIPVEAGPAWPCVASSELSMVSQSICQTKPSAYGIPVSFDLPTTVHVT